MSVRPAAETDLAAVAALYEEVLTRDEALPTPYTNWKRGAYPTADTARAALEQGTLWVAEDGQGLYAALILNSQQLPEYARIPWAFPAQPDEVAVIHTLAVTPRRARQGVARSLVAFCEEESRRRGLRVMRLDTYEGNLPANRLYPALGYRFAGAAKFFFQGFVHETLNCYEKKL